MSALNARENGIISLTPAADYSDKEGYLVSFTSSTATVTAAAATAPSGVIMEGNPTTAGYTTEFVTVGLFGMKGTCRMKATGAITKGARVKQSTDGSIVTDAGGERYVVGIALETAASGDLIEVQPFGAPLYYGS